MGNSTSVTISGLPVSGGAVWVRLYSYVNGAATVFSDYHFTAASVLTPATMASPTVGSTLTGTSQMFSWNPGIGAAGYWLNVGTTQGAYDISSGYRGLSLAANVTGIPTNGGPIWVRLLSYLDGAWTFRDYQYTAASLSTPARITSHVAGSTLLGSTELFTWDAGAGASAYWLDVGSAQGGYEIRPAIAAPRRPPMSAGCRPMAASCGCGSGRSSTAAGDSGTCR